MRNSLSTSLVAGAAAIAIVAGPARLAPARALAASHTQAQAPGSPIYRPCGELDAAIARMSQGLPVQEEWLRSAERQLRDAQSGVADSEAARKTFFREAIKDLITDQLQEAATLKRKVEALKSLGLSEKGRRAVLELAKKAEDIKDAADQLQAAHEASETAERGVDFASKLRENKATLEDFLKFADESGLADEGVSTLALAGGPVAKLVAESGKVLIDFGLTMYGSAISEDELQRARADLDMLRATNSRNHGIVRDLQTERLDAKCPQPDAPEQAQQTTPAPADTHLTPPLPEPEAPEQKSGSAGRAIGMVLGLAVAGGAGLYAYQQSQALIDDGSDEDPGGSSGGITFVSGAFNCRYNAGGVVSSCSESVITVNVTMRLPVGSRLKLATNHIISTGTVPTTRDPQGNITFRGFSGGGWFDQCGPPVTRLILINTSASQNGIAQITGISMPVTCRD